MLPSFLQDTADPWETEEPGETGEPAGIAGLAGIAVHMGYTAHTGKMDTEACEGLEASVGSAASVDLEALELHHLPLPHEGLWGQRRLAGDTGPGLHRDKMGPTAFAGPSDYREHLDFLARYGYLDHGSGQRRPLHGDIGVHC